MATKQKKQDTTTNEPKQRKTRQKANIPENETREQRFIRVCSPRLKKAIKAITNVGNCSNKRVYGYTQEQIERMFNGLVMAIDALKRQFSSVKENEISIDLNVKVD